MTASNSSIFNSEHLTHHVPALTPRRVALAGICALFWIVLIDVSINTIFKMPDSPLIMPTKLQAYFDYGRSVEEKFRLMLGSTDKTTAPIALVGWLENYKNEQAFVKSSYPDKILIAAYGQSFTDKICAAIKGIDSRFEIRTRNAPGAPLSHSYAAYKLDTNNQVDIVLIGVLASSLPNIMGPTMSTTWFESAVPYTYPMYFLVNEKIMSYDPVIHSLDELRFALTEDQGLWKAYLDLMETKSPIYNKWLFQSDIFDHSAFGRLVRRAYGQMHVKNVKERYWNANSGFNNTDGLLDISLALISDFASDVKAKGQIPYIILIQDRGYKNHLAIAFESKLKQLNVNYLSTHEIAPSTNERNFITDGHFTPEVTGKIAQAIQSDIINLLAQH